MQSKMNQCSDGVAEEKDKLKVGLEGSIVSSGYVKMKTLGEC